MAECALWMNLIETALTVEAMHQTLKQTV